jgi:hypothetical protein
MRRAYAVLVDTTHRLPYPGRPGRDFAAEGETIYADDPFWLNLIADGSIALADAVPPAPAAPVDQVLEVLAAAQVLAPSSVETPIAASIVPAGADQVAGLEALIAPPSA